MGSKSKRDWNFYLLYYTNLNSSSISHLTIQQSVENSLQCRRCNPDILPTYPRFTRTFRPFKLFLLRIQSVRVVRSSQSEFLVPGYFCLGDFSTPGFIWVELNFLSSTNAENGDIDLNVMALLEGEIRTVTSVPSLSTSTHEDFSILVEPSGIHKYSIYLYLNTNCSQRTTATIHRFRCFTIPLASFSSGYGYAIPAKIQRRSRSQRAEH
jgi:hypothetical protein